MVKKHLTPMKAIKHYCRYQCCANDIKSWKDCLATDCPLFSYRIGRRPTKKPFREYCSKKPIVLAISPEKQAKPQEVKE